MEQLIWAIIFIIFIIATALKQWAKKKSKDTAKKTTEARKKGHEEREGLGKYLEEIFGIEVPETKPQIVIEKVKPKLLKKRIEPKPKVEKKIGEFVSPLTERFEEKKKIYKAKFPYHFITKKDLRNAIIFSEIIGPPIAKRKSHRLF
ncbi:MAG: hypothetical protein ACE5KZ_04810 [Candidatus Scalinduaceae bacterium]